MVNARTFVTLSLLCFFAIEAEDLNAEGPSGEKEASIYSKGGGFEPDRVVEFKPTNGRPLGLHVFFPNDHKKGDSRPAIVLFFGGGWKGGNPSQMYPQAAYLASRGMVAICAEYRTHSFIKTVDAMDRFLASLGFLSGEPTVNAWFAEQERK